MIKETDWLVVSIPLKNMKASWDDEIPNKWNIFQMFQTTNQLKTGWWFSLKQIPVAHGCPHV